MSRRSSSYDMSQLEREFELEMGDHINADEELEAELESMMDGNEEEYEYDEDSDNEYEEDGGEREYEYEGDYASDGSYAGRLFELSQREFESEYEMESELDQIVDDMHREFFLGGLLKKLKKSKFAKDLIKKGLKLARPFASFIPGASLAIDGLSAATDLLGDNMKSKARSLGKRTLRAIRKEAKVAARDTAAMGADPQNTPEDNQQVAENVTNTIQQAMEFAADNIHYEIDDPIQAERLASRAFEVALAKAKPTPPVVSPGRPQAPHVVDHRRTSVRDHRQEGKGVRVVTLSEKPGEEIEKIVIIIRDRARR